MKHHRPLRNLLLALPFLTALGGCVVAPAPYPAGQPGPVEAVVIAPMAPPPPLVEIVPVAPYAGAIWIGGHWTWSQGRHVWVPGRHVPPRVGHRWEPHRWVQGPRGHWHLRGGHWVR